MSKERIELEVLPVGYDDPDFNKFDYYRTIGSWSMAEQLNNDKDKEIDELKISEKENLELTRINVELENQVDELKAKVKELELLLEERGQQWSFECGVVTELKARVEELKKENSDYISALEDVAYCKTWFYQNKPFLLVHWALKGLKVGTEKPYESKLKAKLAKYEEALKFINGIPLIRLLGVSNHQDKVIGEIMDYIEKTLADKGGE